MDNKTLQQVKDALALAIQQKKVSEELLKNLGPAVIDTLQPILNTIAENSKISREEIVVALSQIKIDVPKADVPQAKVEVTIPEIKVPTPQVTVNVPDVVIPEIKLPTIKVPKPEVTVNVPPIKIPDFPKFPEEMDVKGWIGFMGYDKGLLNNPLPVQIRDANGKPIDLGANLTQVMGGGGKADFLTIKGFSASAYADYINADGRLRVSVETGGSGLTDSELRATAVPVSQVSGANWSVNVIGAFGSDVATSLINADNRLRVSLETGGSGLTDSELRATSVPISQVSGSAYSVNVMQYGGVETPTGLNETTTGVFRVVQMTDSISSSHLATALDHTIDSISVRQVSGFMDSVAVVDIFGSTAATSVFNADNRIRVSLETGGSGLTDSELRATAVPVSQLSGAIWSVNAQDALTTVTATTLVNADNRVRVSLETGGSGLTDSELRATAVPMAQVSGARWSTEATQGTSPWVVSATDLDVRDLNVSQDEVLVHQVSGSNWSVSVTNTVPVSSTDLDIRDLANATDSISAYQVSGANWSVNVVDAFGSTAVGSVFNADNRLRVSLETGGSGLTDSELRATAVPVSQLSGAIWSVSAIGTVTVDGSAVTQPVSATDLDIRDLVNTTDSVRAYQVSGASWSVEATQSGTWTVALSGSLTSAVAVGPTPADTADDGNAPIQIGGIARTANPTAVAANDVVKSTHDDIGRQVIKTLQVRDLILTARATISNGTETTLRAAVAGSYLDCLAIMCANNSDAAVAVDVRAVTAGNVVQTIQVPASGTAGWAPTIPWPQDETGNNWTIDMADITGTTVSVSALFSQEV